MHREHVLHWRAMQKRDKSFTLSPPPRPPSTMKNDTPDHLGIEERLARTDVEAHAAGGMRPRPSASKPASCSALIGVQKAHHNLPRHPLVGRRVAVPQKYTEVEDDGDGFCFDAVVIAADTGRAFIKFKYTGEIEAWSLSLVKSWLSGAEDASLIASLQAL